MLNFDEEIKKFEKSLEPDEIDDALAKYDITDMSDLMFDSMKNIVKDSKNQILHQ